MLTEGLIFYFRLSYNKTKCSTFAYLIYKTIRVRTAFLVLFFSLFLSVSLTLYSQTTNPVLEGWRVHLPYINNNAICQSGSKIFVGSKSGVFVYDENDNSLFVFSKVNGLSDVEVKTIAAQPGSNRIVVVYDNTNIDIIEGEHVYNIPDINNQVIVGVKVINSVSFRDNLAYLACSFGIVVVNMDTKQIIDSYSGIGPGGTNIDIKDVQFFNEYLFASTQYAIYRAPISSPNLGDYHQWSKILTSSYSSLMCAFNGQLYMVLDSVLKIYNEIGPPSVYASNTMRLPVMVEQCADRLVSVAAKLMIVENTAGQREEFTATILYGGAYNSSGNKYQLSYQTGLTIIKPGGETEYTWPQGPSGSTALRMAFSEGNLWVGAGSVDGFGLSTGWGRSYNNSKFYRYTNNTWYNYYQNPDPYIQGARDFIDVAIDPVTKHVYFATFGYGLMEYYNDQVINMFDTMNSTLGKFNAIGAQPRYVSGVDFDNDQNLWVSNFGAVKPLSMKTQDGKWFSFSLPDYNDGVSNINVDKLVGYITCDDNRNKWMISTRGQGLIVFNDGGSFTDASRHKVKLLKTGATYGNLPSNTVICITKDQSGDIWVGTDLGLCIFSNTQNLFAKDFDAKQLIIKTGLVNSIFLGTEPIYCIRVDAANRKWIGTRNGVWLVSADGYTVIRHFTTGNSPLLSNIIYDVGINAHTGEVFFATEKGLISYMGTATDGGDKHGDVLIYPNPVRPEYQGLIAIRGLVKDANVKITDIAGNLVYEAKANGGFATWDGTNFTGKRAATGVYIVYSSNADGTETWVGKILFVN